MDFSDLNAAEPITKDHDRESFTSGVSKLDNFLRDCAIRDAEKNVSRTFVLTLKKHPKKVIGYYSLSSLLVPAHELPAILTKKLPNYKSIGTTLLGKLAVAELWQRDKCALRIGEHLLVDAMAKAWVASQHVASYALVVDILVGEKGDPTGFYAKNQFMPFQDDPMRWFLPMATIEQTLRTSGIIA